MFPNSILIRLQKCSVLHEKMVLKNLNYISKKGDTEAAETNNLFGMLE